MHIRVSKGCLNFVTVYQYIDAAFLDEGTISSILFACQDSNPTISPYLQILLSNVSTYAKLLLVLSNKGTFTTVEKISIAACSVLAAFSRTILSALSSPRTAKALPMRKHGIANGIEFRRDDANDAPPRIEERSPAVSGLDRS